MFHPNIGGAIQIIKCGSQREKMKFNDTSNFQPLKAVRNDCVKNHSIISTFLKHACIFTNNTTIHNLKPIHICYSKWVIPWGG